MNLNPQLGRSAFLAPPVRRTIALAGIQDGARSQTGECGPGLGNDLAGEGVRVVVC